MAQLRKIVSWLHSCCGRGRRRGPLRGPCLLVLLTEVGHGVVSYSACPPEFLWWNLGGQSEGGGGGTRVSSPHFSLKSRVPRRAACMSPTQRGLLAFVLHIGTFDSGISKWGDLAELPHTVRGLCEWRAGYRFWWEGLLKQKSFLTSAPKSEHFIKEKIPTEWQFSGKRC